jgi:arylformamidase
MPVDPHLEKEYDNRGRVPDHPALIAKWTQDSHLYRDESLKNQSALLNLAYGSDPRQQLDLFGPDLDGNGTGALLVFIHGGYWRSLDRSLFSHMAKGANAHGVTVAIPSYRLCPQVSLNDLINDLRQTARFLYNRYKRPMAVAGHSAGGHLTACLLGTDWPAYDSALPARIARHGYSISGLFDLEVMTKTSINIELNLTEKEAIELSPAFWTIPAGVELDAVVGSTESSEYHRQSRLIAERWQDYGAKTQWSLLEGANHFTAIMPLADPDSTMTQRIVALAKAAQA